MVRARERGATKEEIIEVLETGIPTIAKYGRLFKSKIFFYKSFRLGKYYEQKKIEVCYTLEKGQVITVTVYVYYGKWMN